MKVRPLHDRVVVEKVKAPEQSTGGIFLAERFQDSQVAVVIAVGEGRSYDGPGMIQVERGGKDIPENGYTAEYFRQAPRLKAGDVVMFGIHSGTRVSVGDKEHFLLREDEVVAVLEDLDGHLAGEATRILGGKGNGS